MRRTKIPVNKLMREVKNREDIESLHWTVTNLARAKDIKDIIYQMQEYWPLTARQTYYQLISNDLTSQDHWKSFGNPKNNIIKDIYNNLSKLLKQMRIDGLLSWKSIIDEHRIVTPKIGFENPDEFVLEDTDAMFTGYRRCLAHKQEYYIEVWLEKGALFHIAKPMVDQYCRRLVCCRGYNSITFQKEFCDRAKEAIKQGYKPVVLYFGDWDPCGVEMIEVAKRTIVKDFGLENVIFKRCAVIPEQFNWIHSDPVPVKPSDRNAKKFVKEYGRTAYELDAFHPDTLQNLIGLSIEQFTDMDAIQEDLENEQKDRFMLKDFKSQAKPMLLDLWDQVNNKE